MWMKLFQGILTPFFGTSLGAACVFFLRRKLPGALHGALEGFAAGIMTAASFFSLLLPALEASQSGPLPAFLPAALGFLGGIFFLQAVDAASRRLRTGTGMKKTTKLILAVTLHNIPEGLAVGIIYAAALYRGGEGSMTGAWALALGIALQNLPEGAIVSMPLATENFSKKRAFGIGVLSGAVEPIAAVLTLFAAGLILPAMPYLLSFAAGAMFFVVVEELVPEMNECAGVGTAGFAAGFVLMMALDVAFG